MFYTITAVHEGLHIVEVIKAESSLEAEEILINRIIEDELHDSGIELDPDNVAPWIISAVVTEEKPKLVYCD